MMTAKRWETINWIMSGFLICSALFAYYRWHYTSKATAAAGLQTLTEILRLDAIQHAEPQKPPVNLGKTIPDLLARIQERATVNDIAIQGATPNSSEPEKITLDILGDFRNVMLFLNGIESLQASMRGFDIAPNDDGVAAATVELTHTSAPSVEVAFADYMGAMIGASPVRNPFEMGDPTLSADAASELDANRDYRLTGISLLGAERTATIDGADYRIGDEFHGMKVRDIGPYSVTLVSPGTETRKLFFRRSQGAPKK